MFNVKWFDCLEIRVEEGFKENPNLSFFFMTPDQDIAYRGYIIDSLSTFYEQKYSKSDFT